MDWLPPARDFRARLTAASAGTEITALADLAKADLSFLEIIQLDAAATRAAGQAAPGFETTRLGVLAASTVDHLLPAIRVAGLRHGIRIETRAANYGQYRQAQSFHELRL